MPSSSLSRRSKRKEDILLTDIKTTSTCLSLDLPEGLCCDNCKYKHPSNAAHLKKSSHAGVQFRQKSDRRRWYQPWVLIHGEASGRLATDRKHVWVRNYLQTKTDVVIGDCYSYDTNYNDKRITKKKNI